MSLASCSYQCTWIDGEHHLMMTLLANTGDLFQRYSGSALNPTGVVPSWANTALGSGPIIRIVLSETDPNITAAHLAGMVIDSDTKWYVDDTLLTFDGNGESLGDFGGCFRKLTAAPGPNHENAAPCGGLEIRKDLVTAVNGQNATIKCVCALSVDYKGTYLQANTYLKMIKSVGSGNFCSIYCDNNDSFILEENVNDTVVCKVKSWQGDSEVTTFYRKWYLLEGGLWVQKSTSDTFTVGRGDIQTFGEVKVECYTDSAYTGDPFATDIQTIADASDPYVLSPNPTPADGIFYANKPDGDVSFTPKVTDSDGNPPNTPVTGFCFTVLDSVGNIQASVPSPGLPPNTPYVVPWSIANNIKEGPLVVITAEG